MLPRRCTLGRLARVDVCCGCLSGRCGSTTKTGPCVVVNHSTEDPTPDKKKVSGLGMAWLVQGP